MSSLDQNVDNTVDQLDELTENVKETLDTFVQLTNDIDRGKPVEALSRIVECVSSIIEAVTANPEAITKALERITGTLLDRDIAQDLLAGLRAAGQFLEKAISGAINVPPERWLPIAANVLMAASYLHTGNFVGAVVHGLAAVQYYAKLDEQQPGQVTSQAPASRVQQLKIKSEYLSADREQLISHDLP